jgi:general secretion pathway protein D
MWRHKLVAQLSLLRSVAALAALLLLSGCAGRLAYMDGERLLAQGQAEAGLAKLEEAVRHEPRSTEFKSAYLSARDRLVAEALDTAQRAERADKRDEAAQQYRRTLTLDPYNERARLGLNALQAQQRHATLLGEARSAFDKHDLIGARAKLAIILSEQPEHAAALALRRQVDAKAAQAEPDTMLAAAYRKPISIEFKDVPLKQVFEVISRTSGLNFLFDREVRTDQRTSIFLRNSTIAAAVHFTLLSNQLAQQVLDGNTVLIYPNTPTKAKDYQEMMVRTFFLSYASAKTVADTLKSIAKSRDVVVDEKLNMLIVRDSPDGVALAEKLIAVQDMPEPEVMLEVEILEIKRSRLLDLGVQWPSSLTLAPLATGDGDNAKLTVRDLKHLSAGTIGATLTPGVITANKQDSDANILANPRIRVRNQEKAKILIGERIPNITTTSTATGFVSESINYVDIGLKLEVEPVVYPGQDVAIKVALEVSNIVGQLATKSGSLAYQIGTRNANTVLRLKDGENQVLAGLINDEERNSANKLPLLGELPLVGRLFGSGTDNSQKTEIVLSITPRVIRNVQRPEAALAELHAGTDNGVRIRPDPVAMPLTPPAAGKGSALVPTSEPIPAPGSTPAPSSAPVQQPLQPPADTAAPRSEQNDPNAAAARLFWLAPRTAVVGNNVALHLRMQSDQPVSSLPLVLEYDPKTFQMIDVAEGDFLKQGGAQTGFSSQLAPNGRILMTATRKSPGGATAAGTVATVTLRPLAPSAAAPIRLLSALPVGLNGSTVTAAPPEPHLLRIDP